MNVGRVVVGSSAVLALVAAVGFGVAVFGQRPLLASEGTSITCAPKISTDFTFGFSIYNDGKADVTLKSIDFDILEGLTLTDAWVADNDPQSDGTTLGYGLIPYPPTEGHPTWNERVPLHDAIVEPGEMTNVVIRVEVDPDEPAHMEGANIRYVGPGTALGAIVTPGEQFYLGYPRGCS